MNKRLDLEDIVLNGKKETKLNIIRRLKEEWFDKTFVINYGIINMPRKKDLPEEFKLPGTISDVELFAERELGALDYILYNVLSIGIAIGRETMRYNHRPFGKRRKK